MKELNDVLLDINTNNIHNLQSKQRICLLKMRV